MSKMMDVQCNVEFPTEAAYLAHKKSGHATGLEKAISIDAPPVPTPPPGIPAESMPSAEFMESVRRIESREEKAVESQPSASQHPTELPTATPIVLTYRFIGECPEHRVLVDTLELDVASKHFCIAICGVCKKQLSTREVEKL